MPVIHLGLASEKRQMDGIAHAVAGRTAKLQPVVRRLRCRGKAQGAKKKTCRRLCKKSTPWEHCAAFLVFVTSTSVFSLWRRQAEQMVFPANEDAI